MMSQPSLLAMLKWAGQINPGGNLRVNFLFAQQLIVEHFN
jgi:hypothetical protein